MWCRKKNLIEVAAKKHKIFTYAFRTKFSSFASANEQPDERSTVLFDKLNMLEQQSKIVRNVYEALGSVEDYREEIEGSDGELSEDAQDIFDDELTESFEKINRLIQDDRFEKMVQCIDIQLDDHGIARIQRAIAYGIVRKQKYCSWQDLPCRKCCIRSSLAEECGSVRAKNV